MTDRGSAAPRPAWLPLAPPLLAGAVSLLLAASDGLVTQVATYLAVASLVAALGRLAVAFMEARLAPTWRSDASSARRMKLSR